MLEHREMLLLPAGNVKNLSHFAADDLRCASVPHLYSIQILLACPLRRDQCQAYDK